MRLTGLSKTLAGFGRGHDEDMFLKKAKFNPPMAVQRATSDYEATLRKLSSAGGKAFALPQRAQLDLGEIASKLAKPLKYTDKPAFEAGDTRKLSD